MTKRNTDPEFTPEEIEREDPLGEQTFEEEGFLDAPGGGPEMEADGIETVPEKRPARQPQKVAGIPEKEQRQSTTPSSQRPDTQGAVIRERGGASKGDPAVGGTRPE
jgi:hypothetical protein